MRFGDLGCTSSEHLGQNNGSTKRVFSVLIYPGV
jgi:hypothetical protein